MSLSPTDDWCSMEDLKYESWSLGRQLGALYRTVEQLCQLSVVQEATATDEPGEENSSCGDGVDQAHQVLDGLRRKDELLRHQIRDLLVKLPLTNNQLRPLQPSDHQSPGRADEALRHFLANNGGERGGWEDKDHAFFLQWRYRFRNNRLTFIAAVCDTVPGKTAAQVEAHERWYQQLQRLRKEQRQELEEWKRRKRLEAEEERRAALEGRADEPDPAEAWVAEWRKQRDIVHQQIERWKEMRAAKAAEASQTPEEIPEAVQKRNQLEQKRRMEQQYQKLIAYLWRTEQEAAKTATETADNYVARLSKHRPSVHQLEQMKQRDQEWVERRRRQIDRRNGSLETQPTPPRRAKSAPRDPKRLLRPTSAFIARRLDDDSSALSDHNGRYILDLQSRTVPKWRQMSTEYH